MTQIRFLADDMVGRLARWLRLLGYDTYYANPLADERLAAIARNEGRVVLTRHEELAQRYPDLRVHVLHDENPWLQLGKVVREYQLDLQAGLFSRCAICNAVVKRIDKAAYRDRIPERSYEAFDEFWRCPECGRIYWPGTHVARMREQFRALPGGAGNG